MSDLERQLEAEKEKRELLEQEIDTLRIQLHQANENILHYQTLLSARTIVSAYSHTPVIMATYLE